MKPQKNLSRNIFIALILGTILGLYFPDFAGYFSFLGLIFKLSLSMVVMPIIVTSILGGLESVGDVSSISAMGKKAIGYYLCTTSLAILLGLAMVSFIKPGIVTPSQKIQNKISQIKEKDSDELIKQIANVIASSTQQSVESEQIKDLTNSLKIVAVSNDNLDEIKSAALNLMGALEIRSKVDNKEQLRQVAPLPMKDFFITQIEKSLVNPFEALADKQVLAVIIFTLLFGGALTTVGPLGAKIFELNKGMNLAVIKIVGLIMRFAPFGVFGLICEVTSSVGAEVFLQLFWYVVCVVLGLLIHLFILLPAINYFFAGKTPKEFFSGLKPALAIAFSTSSSSATLPVTMQCVEENLKVKKKISSFVLPLGATLNMDGTALYEVVAAIFIAQLFGVSLGFESQVIVAITAALASIGAAGIPAAGTVTMTMVLAAVGLPIEGIGILLAVDRPLDMLRTAVNVASDATGCLVVDKKMSSK